ncbi:MAG: glycerol-3-phosphate dehydrogenase [Alphaproteobacteria bacterium]
MTDNSELDLLVIGGGINGAGIARDAAGRGLRVLLCEQDDLAGATSSASSKLIHGGLRYLERYEFRLVREALGEREVLLRAAPHVIWPLRFVLPYSSDLRPAWMLRLGLLLYDHLGGRELLPGSRAIDLRGHPAGAPLRSELRKGFVYSDCRVLDARLVVLSCLDAAERGAQVLTRTRCTSARRVDGLWQATLEPVGGAVRTVRARALVNAAGPWASRLLHDVIESGQRQDLRMVKGSHIVVRRLFAHDHAYILQARDRRIVFAIPFEQDFTLIGTTDVDFDGDPGDVRISEDEVRYLCAAVNRYFARPIAPEDVVWSYAGVRPLYDDGSVEASVVTRDYVLDVDARHGEAPLLSVFGGKITTFRRLAEHAMEKLAAHLGGMGPAWTAAAPLPGGDIPNADFDAFLAELRARHPWLPDALAHRLARAYGTRAETVIGAARGLDGLGACLGGDLYAAEVDYLVRHEWARTAEDILWRRSKLGLHAPPETAGRLATWLAEHPVGTAAANAAQ